MNPPDAQIIEAGPVTAVPHALPAPAPPRPETEATCGRAFHRYHIETREAPEIVRHPSRFRVKTNRPGLVWMIVREFFALGPRRMRVVMSRPCVYGVFGRPVGGLAPIHDKCVGCLRCTTQYPDVVQIIPNPERAHLGDGYLKPEQVDTIMGEARTGRVPVKGAGYRGAFGGPGWDGMWTDMSEIVRPTRDGIHGRETISTAVDIGEKPSLLRFDGRGEPVGELPRTFPLGVPFFFDLPSRAGDARLATILAEAAALVDTLALLPLKTVVEGRFSGPHIVPAVSPDEVANLDRLGWPPRLVELEGWDERAFRELRDRCPESIVAVRVPADADVVGLFRRGVRVVHLVADYHGRVGARFLGDRLREAHGALVETGIREEVTLLGSGGVVQAEHVPKAIICGLDAVGLDTALWVALQARFPGEAASRDAAVSFPRLRRAWGVQRLANLSAAWRDQLLEILGAMGLREVRRLRGELGRCMFQAELEREAFAEIQARGERREARVPPPTQISRPAPSSLVSRGSRLVPQPVRFAKVEEPHVRLEVAGKSDEALIVEKHRAALHRGFAAWPRLPFRPPAMGDARWTAELIQAGWLQAETGRPPDGLEYRVGASGGGFDCLGFAFLPRERWLSEEVEIDTSIPLNRRPYDRRLEIPVPWYGGGMSFGSISEQVMLARAMAAKVWRTFTSTGEGGYPDSLIPYRDHVNTQVATGMFGVREETIRFAPIVEFKYAQGAKPGLGGHLLGDKATMAVAKMRESVPWVSLFSPFPFHSVYSVEDHKKHIDWVKTINPEALVAVKVSTPTDVDMVAVGSYYAGAHIIHLDGSYGGTGAAPEIAKKNIAMPIELAIPKVHRFLLAEGIRDEVVVMASGGVRTADDIAKAIALGADGCVIGTAELIALGCTRCSNCERGRGCPFGLTTTDPELSQLVEPEWGAERLSNLYASYRGQLADILRRLGLSSVKELRGRTDLLVARGGNGHGA